MLHLRFILPLPFFCYLLLFTSVAPSFADSCITAICHNAIGQLKIKHQPVKEGDCFSCHKSKGKEHPNKGGGFELVAKGRYPVLECHDAKNKKRWYIRR